MTQTLTIIPGDGIGPSITEATLEVLKALQCDFNYEFCDAGTTALEKTGELLPQTTLDLIKKNKIALKGPITTPVGGGFKSMNVTLRQNFELYANLRPVISFPNTKSRYENIDIIIVRENTEGLYCGQGQTLSDDGTRAESKSIVTQAGSERIVEFAFEQARRHGRKKVTAVHKANILKTTSGLFLKTAREVASRYPDISLVEMIVDNACMQLVMNPHQFEVIVTTNLFGDILSDLCAGLVGGLGLAPGANIGKDYAIFEAVHGSAPDIAGQNIANPTALMLATAMLLDHVGKPEKAHRLRHAIRNTLECKDCLTKDLGGTASTTDFTQAVIKRILA